MSIARTLATCLALTGIVASAQAQNTDHPDADVLGPDRQTLFRLDFESNYRTEPVACDNLPSESELVRGTMQFVPAPSTDSNASRSFVVRDVNWLLTLPEQGRVTDDLLVTGRGTYTLTRAVDTLPVLGHRLVLHLRIGDEPVLFDSGLLARGSDQAALDIEVHEVTDVDPCERRHFRVVASRLSLDEVFPYVLGNAASYTFQVSQMGPEVVIPIGGRSALVNLPIEPDTPGPLGLSEWAMVRIHWRGGGSSNIDPYVQIAGAACYQHFTGTFTGVPIERMQAELAVRGPYASPNDRSIRFDSGLVNGSPWPGGDTQPIFHILIEDTNPEWPLMRVDVVAGPYPGP